MANPLQSVASIPSGFSKRLLAWAEDLDRPLPWRKEKNPYKVWLSEMLLQQTRAEQAIPYYHRFFQAFPDVHALAFAPLDTVIKLWEGLGYYNRAQNLHKTAQKVSHDFKGKFPETYEELLALPGIGPYTAAAIVSFAFGGRHPVVDGNVIRLLARVTGFQDSINTSSSKTTFLALATKAMGKADAASFNQAIMDFGAVQCIPRNPDCLQCTFRTNCVAYTAGMVDLLPVKIKKLPLRDRYFLFIVPEQAGKTWLVQRGNTDVWRRLFTFPVIEYTHAFPDDVSDMAQKTIGDWTHSSPKKNGLHLSEVYRQVLSHQRIHARFLRVTLPSRVSIPTEWNRVDNRNFTTFALPKIMNMYLSENPFSP